MTHRIKSMNRIFALILLFLFTFSSLWINTAIQGVSAESTLDKNSISEKIDILEAKYLQKGESGSLRFSGKALYGRGFYENGSIIEKDNYFLLENLLACAAIAKDLSIRNNKDFKNVISDEIYPYISQLKDGHNRYRYSKETSQELGWVYAVDQFQFIEFMTEVAEYDINNKQLILDILKTIESTSEFEAKVDGSYNNASIGAYWMGLNGTNKLWDGAEGLSQYDTPYEGMLNYPMTSTSLWAAVAYAHFVKLINMKFPHLRNTTILMEVEELITKAQNAFSYAEIYALDPDLNLYNEFQDRASSVYYLQTQVLALIAAVRLYEATGVQSYLVKFDNILDAIMQYFWDSGMGGLALYYNSSKSVDRLADRIKEASTNQFFIYALLQAAEALGANTRTIEGYLQFERPSNKYLKLAEETQLFMDTVMWNETLNSYITSVNATGAAIDSTQYATTNLIAICNLNVLYLAEQSFNEFYSAYIINTVIAAVVIIVLIWIIVRGNLSFGGGKISKEVKGLL